MATHATSDYARRPRSFAMHAARPFALIFGLAFLVIGIAGFIPDVTDNHIGMQNYGVDSEALLLGLFQVSVLHNVVHLLFGAVGLMASRTARAASSFLIGGGVVYLALTAYGWLIDLTGDQNFLPVNENDNWLHLGLGSAMFLLGLLTLRTHRDSVDA